MADAEVTCHLWRRIQGDIAATYGVRDVDHSLLSRIQKVPRADVASFLRSVRERPAVKAAPIFLAPLAARNVSSVRDQATAKAVLNPPAPAAAPNVPTAREKPAVKSDPKPPPHISPPRVSFHTPVGVKADASDGHQFHKSCPHQSAPLRVPAPSKDVDSSRRHASANNGGWLTGMAFALITSGLTGLALPCVFWASMVGLIAGLAFRQWRVIENHRIFDDPSVMEGLPVDGLNGSGANKQKESPTWKRQRLEPPATSTSLKSPASICRYVRSA
jgi:hypothetical protein